MSGMKIPTINWQADTCPYLILYLYLMEFEMNTEWEIRNIKSRITLLEGRQPKKENQRIIKKLYRKLRELEAK